MSSPEQHEQSPANEITVTRDNLRSIVNALIERDSKNLDEATGLVRDYQRWIDEVDLIRVIG